MLAKLIITVLTVLLGVSHVSCAEKAEEVVVLEKKVSDVDKENAELNDKVDKLAEEMEKEIEEEMVEIVKEAIEQPPEYVLPQHVLDILQNNQVSYNVWKGRIEEHKKVIALMNSKIQTAQAYQGTDSSSMVHTLRTYLASVGVSYDDLSNWKPEGNKAVRKVPVKKEK